MPSLADNAQLKEYVLFLESLGIVDGEVVSFLAPLLRDLYRTAAKLDKYLEPHGAAFHSAISRLQTTDNPMDIPTHCWIRVVDRLGFFTDHDAHAQRIVNIGLSFAYRHKQVDALAGINALALNQDNASSGRERGDGHPRGDTTAAAGKGVGARGPDVNGAAPDCTTPAATAEGESIPVGGAVLSTRGAPVRESAGDGNGEAGRDPPDSGTVVANQSQGADLPPTPPPGTSGAAGRGMVDAQVPRGGMVIASRVTAKVSDDEQDASERGLDDGDGRGLVKNVHDEQPTVVPTPDAVECVSFVLRTVLERTDAIDVLRHLLADSLLCLVRKRRQEGFKFNEKTKNGRPRTDWTDVHDLTDLWWPMWVARQGSSDCLPELGTVASVANPTRRALTSRWCLLVNMDAVNPIVEQMQCQSRYFLKSTLPPAERVIRLFGKKKLRMTVVVACMLLLATKEHGYGALLQGLASTGRASKYQLAASPAKATRHEFLAAGLLLSTEAPRPPTSSTRSPPNEPESGTLARDAEMEKQYADMDTQLAVEAAAAAADRRAHRMRVRRASSLRAGRPGAEALPLSASALAAAVQSSLPPSSSATEAPPDAKRARFMQVLPLDEVDMQASAPLPAKNAVTASMPTHVHASSAVGSASVSTAGALSPAAVEHGPAAARDSLALTGGTGASSAGGNHGPPGPLVAVFPASAPSHPIQEHANVDEGTAGNGEAKERGADKQLMDNAYMDVDNFDRSARVSDAVQPSLCSNEE